MRGQSHQSKRITITYAGSAVAGKVTNLIYLHANLASEKKGNLQCDVLRDAERHVFFDIGVAEILQKQHAVSQLRIQCITGAVWYIEHRQERLREADAIVFVADSDCQRVKANQEIFEEMEHILQQQEESLDSFPWVLQYNKRDLPNIQSIQELERNLNYRHVPYFEAVASQGIGVMETFQEIIHRITLSKEAPIV